MSSGLARFALLLLSTASSSQMYFRRCETYRYRHDIDMTIVHPYSYVLLHYFLIIMQCVELYRAPHDFATFHFIESSDSGCVSNALLRTESESSKVIALNFL